MGMRGVAIVCVGVWLAGCTQTGTVNLSGSGAVGISTGGGTVTGHAGSGPPPGRTAQERAARKAYYRGPRGDEF